jgi:hypothetical protein
MNATTDTLTPGTIIQHSYEITRAMGEGGMGATFAGRNLATGHAVAIKVISAAFASNKRAIELFKREANLLRTIQHESVVRYETTLQDAQGRLFLVMELLNGQPLSYYINKGASLSSEDVLKLGRRLAGGLDAIAAVGTVHRDIAPDNIFVPDDDIQAAKLIDFGLASNTVGTEKSILGDDFAGKFSYCAPEQLGVFDAPVSPKTDAYALGLVLLKIAGLPVPGEGKGPGAGGARRADLVVPGDKISPALQTLLSALLRVDPAQRPSPITPLFETALRDSGTAPAARSEKTEAAISGAARKQGLNKGLIAGIAAAVVAVAVAGVFLWPQIAGTPSPSVAQGQMAADALQTADPLAEIAALIAKGDSDSLNGAFGALLAMGRDAARDTDTRIKALMMAAQMTDPKTHAITPTPFAAPDLNPARRIYQSAADLGSADAATRLTEE